VLGGAASGPGSAGRKGRHVAEVRGKANRNGMECGVALQLIQRVLINGGLGKIHLDAESAAKALGALDYRVEPLEA